MSAGTATSSTTSRPMFDIGAFVSRWGTIISLGLIIVLFAILKTETFATTRNMFNILNQVSILAIIACGLTVCLVMGLFDLSIGAVATLGGYVAIRWAVATGDGGVVLVILAVLVLALLIGVIHGMVVSYMGVSAFIATLATASVLSGIALGYSGTLTISTGVPDAIKFLGQAQLGPVPAPVVVMALVALLLWLFLERTEPGRHLYAIGSNAEAARLSGIRTQRYPMVAMGAAAVCSALGGIVASANIGIGRPHSTGDVYLLDAFAAAFIGAATLRPGRFHILGTIVGVLLLGVINNGLSLLGADTFWQMIVKGLILILAVFASGVTARRR